VELPDVNKPIDSFSQFRFLIHGWPKVGKTTLACQWPEPIVLDCESGSLFLPVRRVPISSWSDVQNAVQMLVDQKSKDGVARTVIIDPISKAYAMLCDAVAKENRVDHISQMRYGQGYDAVNRRLQAMLDTLYKAGFGVVLIAHTKGIEEVRDAMQIDRMVPDLSDSPRRVVVGWSDVIIYIAIEETESEDGVIQMQRVAICQPTPSIEAGGRLRYLPARISLESSPKEGFERFKLELEKGVAQLLKEFGA